MGNKSTKNNIKPQVLHFQRPLFNQNFFQATFNFFSSFGEAILLSTKLFTMESHFSRVSVYRTEIILSFFVYYPQIIS